MTSKAQKRDELAWFAVKTNPRCEDRAVASIGRIGVEVYAPKLRKHIVHHRSKKLIARDFPLLTGYVFVGFEGARHFGDVRQCDGVKCFLGVAGTPERIPDDVVDAVRDFEGSEWLKQDIDLRHRRSRRPFRGAQVKMGEEVLLTKGVLSGFVGRVIDAKDKRSVKIITHAFGKLTEVTVNDDDLLRAA